MHLKGHVAHYYPLCRGGTGLEKVVGLNLACHFCQGPYVVINKTR